MTEVTVWGKIVFKPPDNTAEEATKVKNKVVNTWLGTEIVFDSNVSKLLKHEHNQLFKVPLPPP